jgi:hypothetical protein
MADCTNVTNVPFLRSEQSLSWSRNFLLWIPVTVIFTRAHNYLLPWARLIPSMPTHPIYGFLPSMLRSSKQSLPFRFPDQTTNSLISLVITFSRKVTSSYLFFSVCYVTGHAIQVHTDTTAVRTCAVDEATGLSVSRKWNVASASITGAVTFNARRAAVGWTLTNVTNTSSMSQ